MSRSNRLPVLVTLLMLSLVGCALWSFFALDATRSAAREAAEDLKTCREIALSIGQLRKRPSVAGLTELQTSELSRQIESAAKSAQMAPQSLVRITPEQPRRVDESAYKESPTQVLLKNVTLRQLSAFLITLTAEDSGLEARALRLSAPREEETGDLWNAETTLSYLVYAPSKKESGLQTHVKMGDDR